MESDEETFSMSRSWDDIEGARSILNLNSPNGFHPLSLASSAPPTSFVLPVAARAPPPPSAAEKPDRSHFTSFTPSAATPSVPIPPPRSMVTSLVRSTSISISSLPEPRSMLAPVPAAAPVLA